MDENNTTNVAETTAQATTQDTTTSETVAINFAKLDESTKVDETKDKEPTVQELQILLQKERDEKAKIKASFDKKAKEKAEAEKKAKEAQTAADEPVAELARLKTELEEMQRNNMKTSLTFTLSKEWGVSDELTSKMVTSIFSEETGGFVEGDFRTAQLELIKSVREQAKKEGYEERDREIANGKPRSLGQTQSSDPFDEISNKYKPKK